MRSLFRVLSTLTAAGALTAAATVAATPALANAGVDAGIVLGPNGTSSTAIANVVLGARNGDGTRAASFTCEGLSTGDVVSTAVRSCTLRVNGITVQSAPAIALPGATAASGGVRLSVPVNATISACTSVLSVFAISPFLSSSKCSRAMTVVA